MNKNNVTNENGTIDTFTRRHIGNRNHQQEAILEFLGVKTTEELVQKVVPENIYLGENYKISSDVGYSEVEATLELKKIAEKNQNFRSLIGQGYYGTHTPAVILRNLFENPAWYTSYTPYQPEISQGRLEALINFQTMVCDLTGFDVANASMLDEATAAAEAMTFCKRSSKSKSNNFFVCENIFPQTISVIKTRAKHQDINLIIGSLDKLDETNVFGAIFQYPNSDGAIIDYNNIIDNLHKNKVKVAMIADILALTLITPPAELGADIAVGNTQRFGVPLGFGGPHAAYMATTAKEKRNIPGRIVGVSVDSNGKPAYRLALQTREQHIRREKASSNICTAQALLAIMAGAYAVYHGAEKLKELAQRINNYTNSLKSSLEKGGFKVINKTFFDTLTINCKDEFAQIIENAKKEKINFRIRKKNNSNIISISLDEVTTCKEINKLIDIFGLKTNSNDESANVNNSIPKQLVRTSKYLTHPVFNSYHSETSMMRYLRKLADFDLALDRTMIPLGSCTMKLNPATAMAPVSWAKFNNIHPFAPKSQYQGYIELFKDLEQMLCEATGYDAISLQPNSGAQGEYAGLLAIKNYHKSRGDEQRNICLIPNSAHGTNPASATLAGMKVITVLCDNYGNIDIVDLKQKAEEYKDTLSAIMITYPSTHGVFETSVVEVCEIIHKNGGQIYLDGANLQAQVGLSAPGKFGADVSHLNLHKTFAIPHGGGGPGVGPIGVKSHLTKFLPNHCVTDLNLKGDVVSASAWGSASILPITWSYMKMMGAKGLRKATVSSILNANYIAQKLRNIGYEILYSDKNNLVAHECIVDTRVFDDYVTVDDIAKRLMDFGFHAPTMSFPVAGTLMIEPTESEDKQELDRFCDAMEQIYNEIQDIKKGKFTKENNPLINAPHTVYDLTQNWDKPYSQEQAIFLNEEQKQSKYFTPVNRIDNVYGDRHLVCIRKK